MIDTGHTCADCAKPILRDPKSLGAGYGTDATGAKVCYACCGARDTRDMIDRGKAVLYAVGASGPYGDCEITNWPGSIRFKARFGRGRHNWARYRYDGTFTGPDGKPWRFTQYGDNTQIAHCRRAKA